MFKTYNVISNAKRAGIRDMYIGRIIGSRDDLNETVLIVQGADEILAFKCHSDKGESLVRVADGCHICKGVTAIDEWLEKAILEQRRVHIAFVTPELFEYEEAVGEFSDSNFGLPIKVKSDFVRRIMRDERVNVVSIFVDEMEQE